MSALAALRSTNFFTTEFTLLPEDAIRWHYPQPPRIVAIGDLHGDLQALAALCRQARLIDEHGRWIGGDAHLVLLGDLVGGKKDSRLLLDLVMRLEREAQSAGGRVHALLGNHDLLPVQGLLHGMTAKEIQQFQDFDVPQDAFRGMTHYAQWLRTRNSIIRLGSWLFAHAGIDSWALTSEPGAINATVRAWLRYWQKIGPKPPDATHWVVASDEFCRQRNTQAGPLWNRTLKVKRVKRRDYHCPSGEALAPNRLQTALSRWQAKRLVVGHSRLESGEILLRHPLYKEHVVMIDTCISAVNGVISALCIEAEQATPLYLKNRRLGQTIRCQQKIIARQGATDKH